MIFNIYRTSNVIFSENKPPCDSENKPPCDKAFIKEFEGQGKDWFIELNTLEDLLNLKEEVDEPVIINDFWKNNNIDGVKYSIEIYDDYRE